jgi:hypothetical protein
MMETQEALNEFAKAMSRTLDENQEKKGDSWNDCDLQFLLNKLDEEIKEFKDELKPLAKAEELVDVANICMMLYHRYVDIWAEKVNNFLENHSGKG